MDMAARHISDFEAINQDHFLKPFEYKIKDKLNLMNNLIKNIEQNEISLIKFSEGYKFMGLNIIDDHMCFKEYAPGAKSMSIVKKYSYIKNLKKKLIIKK